MDFFSEYPTQHPALLPALLSAVCAYEMSRKSSGDGVDKAWGDITLFYQLALSSRSTKILSTGKRSAHERRFVHNLLTCFLSAILSSYAVATAKQLVEDPLTCAEVTSAIISALLLILTDRILADELPLALLSSPSLCQALTALIRVADNDLGKLSFSEVAHVLLSSRSRVLFDNDTLDARRTCRVETALGGTRGRIVY